MKKKIEFFAWLILLVMMHGCHAGKETTGSGQSSVDKTTASKDLHVSSNSLDWDGTYKGILPCADCEGINTELTLQKDNTYKLKTSYLGKSVQPLIRTGTFTWNAAGNTVILTGLKESPNQYFVGENKIRQLDMTGNIITGKLAENYILLKQ